MAGLTADKLKQIEAEMNRFEQEVLSNRTGTTGSLKFLPHSMLAQGPPRMRPGMLPPPPFLPGMGGMPPMRFPRKLLNPGVIEASPEVYSTTIEQQQEAKAAVEAAHKGEGNFAQQLAAIKAKDYKKIMEEVHGFANVDHDQLPSTSAFQAPPAAVALQPPPRPPPPKAAKKKKAVVRTAAGQVWEDNSLMEWDSNDFRLFCGDLGNEVSDELLAKAFRKYSSFQKAKVIRDKRTNKTKGYGFVSFSDSQDFIKAMREMDGKYVGNRPIKLRKSTWKERSFEVVKQKKKEKRKLGLFVA